ncbi:MAG TPA: cytochrome P450 [Trebonia sp.]|jgi:cytochrome P450
MTERSPSFPQDAVRLYGPEFADSPARSYRDMRQRYGPVAPVLLDGDVPAWIVLSYREVHLAMSSPELFGRDSRRWNLWDRIPPDWSLMPYVAWAPSALFAEGAEHQRRAGAISDALDAVDRVELAGICEWAADRLIDSFVGDGAADLLTQYAQQIPTLVVSRLFGMAEADIQTIADDFAAAGSEGGDAMKAFQRLYALIERLVAERRAEPGPGVPSRLIVHPAGLTDEEIATDLQLVMSGSQQPTSDWIGNTLRLMLTDDQFSITLQGGRSNATQALNEVLWKDTPIQNLIGRWAAQDCEFGGQRIKKGDMLVLCLAAANTDPQARPDSFAGTSMNRAHMSFAHGEHSCPFAAPELAEIMAKTAVEVLLDRIPDVALTVPPGNLNWRRSAWIRGLESLPVSFTPTMAVAPLR